MKNLIFNAFSFSNNTISSPNLQKKMNNQLMEIYLKNIFVSLKSAKIANPRDDVAIITNIDIPSNFEVLFKKNHIEVIICEFNKFIFPNNFKWKHAFYKLNALEYIINSTKYDNYLLLDSDTLIIDHFDDLWMESKQGILLYNINHTYSHIVRRKINEINEVLYKNFNNIIHYGGEIVCGNREHLRQFIMNCNEIYIKIQEYNFKIDFDLGDELLISIAASKIKDIYSANAYIERYWTGRFYLVSTKYHFDKVSILHLPAEKSTGLLKIFNYMKIYEDIPKHYSKILGLPKKTRPNFVTYNVIKILRNYAKK